MILLFYTATLSSLHSYFPIIHHLLFILFCIILFYFILFFQSILFYTDIFHNLPFFSFLRYKKFQGEWDDFAAEEQAFKKFKKGKLSKDVYEDALLAESAPDEHDIEVAAKKGKGPSFTSFLFIGSSLSLSLLRWVI